MQSRDGMDITICILEDDSTTMNLAGAYNPLYQIRNGELKQFKVNKFSIGVPRKGKELTSFDDQFIEIEKGDSYYLFSDGYADQLGGQSGDRKFFYPPFRNMILDNNIKPMREQQEIYQTTITEWRGETEQTDDILLIGFRI